MFSKTGISNTVAQTKRFASCGALEKAQDIPFADN